MTTRGWTRSFLALATVVLLVSLMSSGRQRAAQGEQAGAATGASVASAANAIAVDAVSGGAVEPGREVTGTGRFDVDIVVTDASTPYAGYEYNLEWDPAVLGLDTAVDLNPTGLMPCLESPRSLSHVSRSCGISSEASRYVGAVATIGFHCVADGSSPLHLLKEAESGLYTQTFERSGEPIDTTLADASVTCRGTGREAIAAPHPTPLPIAPSSGSGGYLEEP
jgi:hypothetical protein